MAEEEPERAQFANNCQLILALVSFAVGLGNIWRFPYLVFDNGGGTFLVPYTIALFCLGLPVFVLELGMGQLLREGIVNIWVKLGVPKIRGVGTAATITSLLICVYYIIIVTWTISYIFRTVGAFGDAVVPWSDQAEGTECPQVYFLVEESVVDEAWWNEEKMVFNPDFIESFGCPDGKLPAEDSTLVNYTKFSKTPTECPAGAAVNYFENVVLKKSKSIMHWNSIHWDLLAPFTLAWVLAYILVFKGVELSGKLVYVTSTMPYVCLIILFFRAVTLPNAGTGLRYYVTPDFSALIDPLVWQKAASQIFYSLSVGIGGIVAFGSYGAKDADYPGYVLKVALINCGTSLFAGIVVMSILGFLAEEMSKINPCYSSDDIGALSQVGISGPGLAFIAFPVAIARMGGSHFWALMFFFMLFFLGLGSVFPFVESVVTVLNDSGYAAGWPRWKLAGVICGACWLFGLIFITEAGQYWVTLFDSYSAAISLLFVGCLECIGFMWLNPNIWENTVRITLEILPYRDVSFWKVFLKYVAPFLLAVLMILSLTAFDLTGLKGDAQFPVGILLLGWFMALLPVFGCIWTVWLVPKELEVDTRFTEFAGVTTELEDQIAEKMAAQPLANS